MSFSTILESNVDESYHHGYPLYLANSEIYDQDRKIEDIEHEDLTVVGESAIEDKRGSDIETGHADGVPGSRSDIPVSEQNDEDEENNGPE